MYANIDYNSYKNDIKKVGINVTKSTFDVIDEFKEFIVSRGIFSIAIGLLLATQISILSKSLSQGLIDPIVSNSLSHVTKDLTKVVVTIYNMEFKIGLIISDLINLLCIIIIIFIIWKLTIFVYNKYDKKQDLKKQ